MHVSKHLIIPSLLFLFLTGCSSFVSTQNENGKANSNQPVEANNQQIEVKTETNLNSNDPKIWVANQKITFVFELTPEKEILSVKNEATGEVYIPSVKDLCLSQTMIFAHRRDSMRVILRSFDPGSDKPVSSLYQLDLQKKTCHEMAISSELGDFGERVLSPDQTKLAVALETNEARELKVLDLVNDSAKTLVTLPEGQTFNGGYGALSNHFEIRWLDDYRIQYVVYENTVNNYAANAPQEIENTLEVRGVSVE